ncbi:MAG TPA: serine/threonine-protein kinase [Polyangiaceae bacterium]|nr:serine/threonine-protein kinase [Polyangiaceae bacterium]
MPSSSGMVAPGQVLGRYELLMPIAAGGMAMVWAARLKGTRGFQKVVAIKTMLPKLSDESQFEQMFLDEASLASQVRHPHVVEILDLGEQDGVLFLVMEWIDGMPLNQLMKAAKAAGGMPLPVAVRIVMQACAGLHAAHELKDSKGQLVGLVHRDVSPQNILVTYDGVTKVVDFGVAKATAAGGGTTSAGQIKGKVGYMAPEQIEGESIDRRADVFAIGIVLYALTTGKHPFRRESDAATMYNICSPQPVLPPRKFLPDYPEQLERVILRALAKSPGDRYESANALLRDLDHALPASERANTDEDVARFVRKLLGEKLDERRATLSDALTRADQNTESRLRFPPAAPSLPSASAVSTVELAQSLLPLDSHATATALDGVSPFRNWKLIIGGAAAAVFLVLLTVLLVRSPTPPPIAAPVAPKVEAPAKVAEPAEPIAMPRTEVESLAVEKPAASAKPETPPTGARGGARGPWPAPATSAKAPVKNWRQDPGF